MSIFGYVFFGTILMILIYAFLNGVVKFLTNFTLFEKIVRFRVFYCTADTHIVKIPLMYLKNAPDFWHCRCCSWGMERRSFLFYVYVSIKHTGFKLFFKEIRKHVKSSKYNER